MLKKIRTTGTGSVQTIYTVPAGTAALIVSLVMTGGASGGDVSIVENDGAADAVAEGYTIAALDTAVIDHKIVLVAGESLKVTATAGIGIKVSLMEVAQ